MKSIKQLRKYVDGLVKIIFALLLTFLWMIVLFFVGSFFGMSPLPYQISTPIFYLLAGGISVYFTCTPIGFNRKNLPFCILAFFSVAFMPLVRLALQTRVRTWFVCLLFICGIPFWGLLVANPARMVIGGRECSRVARGAVRDMTSLQVALSVYQTDYKSMVPLSFRELYQDKKAVIPLRSLTLSEVEGKYRYLPPTQEPPAKETLLIYERKPSWHFHTLGEGEFRVYTIGIDKEGELIQFMVKAPKERYGGELRRVFFWYFIGTPFKGPEELTPEEIQKYCRNNKKEWGRLPKNFFHPK